MPETPDIIIIGAGFAGAATAMHLTRSGRPALLLEREPTPGQWASGRNAGMVRTLIADAEVQRLALASARAIAARREGVFERTGSLILASEGDVPGLREAAARSRDADREVLEVDRAPAGVAHWLEGAEFEAGFSTPGDGIADVDGLLHGLLREALAGGSVLETDTEVLDLVLEGGRCVGVVTPSGALPAAAVVNAAGAWAGEIGAPGSAEEIGIRPMKRHLHSTGPIPGVAPAQPFVWNDSKGYYFRPESGGLLLSGCDHTPEPPGPPLVDPDAEDRLARKLLDHAPALADLPVARRWACHRSFSADDRFAIGWDPALRGLYWVAALGGHGVTVSDAVGALAAREILSGASDSPFSPARFARNG